MNDHVYEQVMEAVRGAVAVDLDDARAERVQRRRAAFCVNPGGHTFITQCGATTCVHCNRIAWR